MGESEKNEASAANAAAKDKYVDEGGEVEDEEEDEYVDEGGKVEDEQYDEAYEDIKSQLETNADDVSKNSTGDTNGPPLVGGDGPSLKRGRSLTPIRESLAMKEAKVEKGVPNQTNEQPDVSVYPQ